MRILPLIFGLALVFGPANTAWAGNDGDVARFLKSDYSVCDAHFVGKMLSVETADSKAYIGQKIRTGTTDFLDGMLQQAREKGKRDRTFRCQWHQAGLPYSDAEALARHWGVSVTDAKARAEEKILWGNEDHLRKTVLPAARGASTTPTAHQGSTGNQGNTYEGNETLDATGKRLAAFSSSPYDICHARMLLGSWFGDSMRDVKSTIGQKVLINSTEQVDSELDPLRQHAQATGATPCAFHQTPYTYKDAQALAGLWGTSVSDAKARVERKYAFGTEGVVPSELQRAAN